MSDYLKRFWGFLKWHKKKFIALGVFSGLGVAGYYYAKRMVLDSMRQVEELGRGLQEKMMEAQHRQKELDRIRSECAKMILTFIPPLRSQVKQLTDPKPVTEKLKAVRMKRKTNPTSTPEEDEQVKQLWDELKVVSLTRLIGSIYSLAFMNAILRIQLHILGRNAFEEAAEHRSKLSKSLQENNGAQAAIEPEQSSIGDDSSSDSDEPNRITRQVRERFLFSGSDHLMESGVGMHCLIRHIHDSIKIATKDWLMGTNDSVTRMDIINMMDKIRNQIENNGEKSVDGFRSSDRAREWFISCLIPENEEVLMVHDPELSEEQNKLFVQMLEETLDMIESPVFAQALEVSFDRLFDILRTEIQNRPFEVYKKPSAATTSASKSYAAAVSSPSGEEESNNNDGSNTDTNNDDLGIIEEEEEDRFLLTKVIVSMKLVASQVLSDESGMSEEDRSKANQFEEGLKEIPEVDTLCTAIFQQGADDGENPLDALGLGDLGIGDDDLKSLAGLLGSLSSGGFPGLGGGPGPAGAGGDADLLKLLGGGGDEAELMKMFGELMAAGGDGGSNSPMGGIGDDEMMQMLQSVAGGAGAPPQQRRQ